jgi:hypothetical protein
MRTKEDRFGLGICACDAKWKEDRPRLCPGSFVLATSPATISNCAK